MKAQRALEALRGSTPSASSVSLSQKLPVSRGYGTSTADIGAVLFAAARAAGYDLTPHEAARLAVSIEPTDSTYFPGLTLFDHRSASWTAPLGDPPPAEILVIDPGGQVDTEAFNSQDWRSPLRRLEKLHRDTFDLLEQGVSRGDLARIGAAATLSAMAHQSILPNPWLETAVSLAHDLGAAGVCRAHSGTVLGLLIAPDRFSADDLVGRARAALPSTLQVWLTKLRGGGVCWSSSEAASEQEVTR